MLYLLQSNRAQKDLHSKIFELQKQLEDLRWGFKLMFRSGSLIGRKVTQDPKNRKIPRLNLKTLRRDQNLLHKNGPEALLLNDEHRLSRLDSSMHEELERLASSVKSDFDSHKGTLVRSQFWLWCW